MQAGLLRHVLAIQRKQSASDGRGGRTVTWSTVASVRASVEPMSGAEGLSAARLAAGITHEVRMRQSSDVAALTPADRLLWVRTVSGVSLTSTLEILSVADVDQRNRELVIQAKELAA